MAEWYEGNDVSEDEEFERVMKANRKRFWLTRGESRKIVFMTDEPVFIWEHDFRVDGHFGNYFTCLRYLKVACPGCKTTYKAKKVAVYRILDLTPFVVGEGTEDERTIEYFRRFLVAPLNIHKVIMKKRVEVKEKHDLGLAGAMFEVIRGEGDRAAKVGDIYRYLEHTDLTKYTWTNSEGVETVLEPLSMDWLKPNEAAMQSIVNKLRGITTNEEKDVTEEDVPF